MRSSQVLHLTYKLLLFGYYDVNELAIIVPIVFDLTSGENDLPYAITFGFFGKRLFFNARIFKRNMEGKDEN